MNRQEKKKIILKHQAHKQDTGSPQVQIAILSHRIQKLTGHLEKHKKDNHSRRGLLIMVGKRRQLLNYLKARDEKEYEQVIETLKLRK